MPDLNRRIFAALGLVGALLLAPVHAQQPPPPPSAPPPSHPAIEPGALDRLKATSQRLAGGA